MKARLKKEKKKRRRLRVSKKLRGKRKFRLFVFRSNKHIYAQLIDEKKGKTLFSVSDLGLKKGKKKKTELAKEVGKLAAKEAIKRGIKEISFDRGGYKYHGRVKALAEGAREERLEF
jgi:large subunit ribosomal protein L18